MKWQFWPKSVFNFLSRNLSNVKSNLVHFFQFPALFDGQEWQETKSVGNSKKNVQNYIFSLIFYFLENDVKPLSHTYILHSV